MFLPVILAAVLLIPSSSGYLSWAWRVEPTLDRSEYEPGSKGTIDESVVNTGPTILHIYATVIMFDWQKQSGNYWSMNVNVEVSPAQQAPLAKLAFEIPANVTPGKHTYEIGLRHRHLGLREGWQDDGLQWYPSTYEISVSKSSFKLDLVATAMAPKGEEGLYIGDVSTATFTLKNSGGTVAKQVRVAIEEIKTGIISLAESSPAKDLEAGATGQWTVKARAEKAGETTSRVRIYVSEKGVHDSELRIVVVEPTLEIVSVSRIPEEGKPIYPGEVLTATFIIKNRMRSTVREVSISAEIPSGITVVESSQPINFDQDSTGQLTLKIRAGNPGRYDAKVFLLKSGIILPSRFTVTINVSEKFAFDQTTIALAGTVVVLALVVLVIAKRGRKPTESTVAATVFCIKCGAPGDKRELFCKKCGTRLR